MYTPNKILNFKKMLPTCRKNVSLEKLTPFLSYAAIDEKCSCIYFLKQISCAAQWILFRSVCLQRAE